MHAVLSVLGWPLRWWQRQSLRARLTLIATALFTIAVTTGAILVLVVQRYALLRVLDSSAAKTASSISTQWRDGHGPTALAASDAGVVGVQVVNLQNTVLASTSGQGSYVANSVTSMLTPDQLDRARRSSSPIDIVNPLTPSSRLRVLARDDGGNVILVATDLSRVDDSLRILGRAALIGGPLAVVLMALATYSVVALTLRPVAALRHGADDITAAGLADQRLPEPGTRDEINRLAVTLNAMLDRIDAATSRQRTFVGDAAHELRSPLASLRVQLEVAQRLGPAADWSALMSDVLVDVSRLDRLVQDLLALARIDESRGPLRRTEPVDLRALLDGLGRGYAHARVPVHVRPASAEDGAAGDGAAADGAAVVDGDPEALRRVAVNLIDNAVRYATTHVEVAVFVRPASTEPGDYAEDEPPDTVVLTVTDDGPGIPPAERDLVFDRFYRVNASRSRDSGGTGLGLPIVRDLTRAHGGQVVLTDAPGRSGLQAVVTLPAAGSMPPLDDPDGAAPALGDRDGGEPRRLDGAVSSRPGGSAARRRADRPNGNGRASGAPGEADGPGEPQGLGADATLR